MNKTMHTYIGTKIIRAIPMTRGGYNVFRGWTVPPDERPEDEGYLVEYLDGGAPNTKEFAGYVSWSPKAQFEAAYVHISYGENLTEGYQLRVAGEKAELDARREKLFAFTKTSAFDALERREKSLLSRQLVLMDDLSSVLGERIAGFYF